MNEWVLVYTIQPAPRVGEIALVVHCFALQIWIITLDALWKSVFLNMPQGIIVSLLSRTGNRFPLFCCSEDLVAWSHVANTRPSFHLLVAPLLFLLILHFSFLSLSYNVFLVLLLNLFLLFRSEALSTRVLFWSVELPGMSYLPHYYMRSLIFLA